MSKRKNHAKKKSLSVKIDPIYLPIEKPSYKENKIRLLQTQMKIIDCVGHLENLRKLKKEKAALFSDFKTMISASVEDFRLINSAMPSVSQKIEFRKTTVTQKINFEKEITVTRIERVSREEGLDKELREIQEKLSNLGAY
jgi:hypothetical protein